MIRVSAPDEQRIVLAVALAPFFTSKPVDDGVFLSFLGPCANAADAKATALANGAESVDFEEDWDDLVQRGEPTPEGEEFTVDIEDPEEGKAAPSLTPFTARFADPDDGLAFVHTITGLVTFSEPPTGWTADHSHFFVQGSAVDLGAIYTAAKSHSGVLA